MVQALRLLLEDPAMVHALTAVDTLARPRSIPPFNPGTPHDTTIAHEFCERAGVNTTLTYLRAMCYGADEKTPFDPQDAEETPFQHAIPANLISKDEH